jgi:peroxiredoxin
MDGRTRRRLARAGASPTLEVGELAPDFELRRTFEETVRLSEHTARGPVLLVFYVFDFGHV